MTGADCHEHSWRHEQAPCPLCVFSRTQAENRAYVREVLETLIVKVDIYLRALPGEASREWLKGAAEEARKAL